MQSVARGLPILSGLGLGMGGSTGFFEVFQRRWISVWVQPCVGAMETDNDPPSSAPVTSLCLSPQESEISEHVKQLQLLDSAASDPKSFLGLVSLSLRWGWVWVWWAAEHGYAGYCG